MDVRWLATKPVKQFTAASDFAGKDHAAQVQEMLARAYLPAGNRTAALEHRLAIGRTAAQEKPVLLEFEKQLASGH